MTDEMKLMIACARTNPGPGQVMRIQQLADRNINWEQMVLTSIRHKVLPLVFQNLCDCCPDSFPEEIRTRVEESYIFENALNNHALVETLFSILSLMETHNIQVVPFKGPVLSENLFGDIGLRRYLDLDLLISKKDAVKAIDLLAGMGFIPDELQLPATEEKAAFLERLTGISLIRDISGHRVSLDLQWDIANRFARIPVDLELISDCIEEVTLSGRQVHSLSPEVLLCYLCIHGAKHRWMTLDLVCCINQLIQVRQDINWEQTVDFAKKIHCQTAVLCALYLSRYFFDTVLPETIVRKIESSRTVEQLAQEAAHGMIDHYHDAADMPEKFDSLLFGIQDSLWDRIRYGCRIFFLPTKKDFAVFSLPGPFLFLWYGLRPMRLAGAWICRKLRISIRIDNRRQKKD